MIQMPLASLFGLHLTARRAAPYGWIHRIPFSAGPSRKTQCQRRVLDFTSLVGGHLLKRAFPMAQYFRLPRNGGGFRGRRESTGCMVLLRTDCGGSFSSSIKGKSVFQKLLGTTAGSSLFWSTLYFHRLVGFSFSGFQAVDQSVWCSDHGAHRSDGT